MKQHRAFVVAAVLAVCLGFAAAPARGQETSAVPSSLEQIGDPLFRDALAMYSPGYNGLTRPEQVRAYVNMYRVLNNGASPQLTVEESVMASQVERPLVRRRPEPRLVTDLPLPPPALLDEYTGTIF